ncbi:MAG: carboxypeptidase-like regulatory domain-containing protein [Ignavibacteriota bacterium]
MPLQVGKADMRDISLEIAPIEARNITGTIRFLGDAKPHPVSVTLRRESGETKSVVSNADGSFVLEGLLPGRHYLYLQNKNGGGMLVAAQLGTQDVTSQVFDLGTTAPGELKISMAGPVAQVRGRVLDAAGHPVSGASVLFLSRADHIRSYGRTKEDGSFTASILTTGEHRVFTVTRPEDYDSLGDPLFLESHENDFAPVTISEGSNLPITLRISGQ